MKIVAVNSYSLVMQVEEIYGGAAGFLEDCRSLLVRVQTETGIEGWGEATQGRPGNATRLSKQWRSWCKTTLRQRSSVWTSKKRRSSSANFTGPVGGIR